jgi:hypothetical protein
MPAAPPIPAAPLLPPPATELQLLGPGGVKGEPSMQVEEPVPFAVVTMIVACVAATS